VREEEARRRSEERILVFAPAEVREVRLDLGGSATILLRKGGGWTIAGNDTADAGAVEAYLERLASIRRKGAVAPADGGLAGFGLDPPRARLAIALSDGRSLSVDIGDDNPFDRTLYARVGGAVLVLPGSARAALALDPASLRPRSAPDGGNQG
jgi:hypothetical protein